MLLETIRAWSQVIFDTIFPARESEVLVRDVPRDFVARHMRPSRVRIKGLDTGIFVTALLPYRARIVQALITEAKFEGNAHAQTYLGEILATYVQVHIKECVLIPLPLGNARRKERGYNQVEEVAKHAIAHLSDSGIRVMMRTDVLSRTRDTAPQTTLGRMARLQNMRGSFAAAPSSLPPRPLPHLRHLGRCRHDWRHARRRTRSSPESWRTTRRPARIGALENPSI